MTETEIQSRSARSSRSPLGGLLVAQFFGAFNDNAFKMIVALLGIAAVPAGDEAAVGDPDGEDDPGDDAQRVAPQGDRSEEVHARGGDGDGGRGQQHGATLRVTPCGGWGGLSPGPRPCPSASGR